MSFFAHRAPFGTCVLAHLDGLEVDAEHKLSCVNGLCYSLTDVFAKQASRLPAQIELPTGNKIWNCVRTLSPQTGKEIVLAVDTEGFRYDGKCHNLQVGEGENNTTARNISTLIYLISCKLFADFKIILNFAMKLCIAMMIELNNLNTTKLLKINDMSNFFIVKKSYKLIHPTGYKQHFLFQDVEYILLSFIKFHIVS